MKKIASYALAAALAVGATVTASAVEGAKLDPITVARMESLINTKKLVSREFVPALKEGVTVTNVIETYRQGSPTGIRTWSVTNELKAVVAKRRPAKYSTLRLLTAIADAGKYSLVKNAMQTQTLPNGMPYWDALMSAQFLMEDDPRLQAGVQLAVAAGLCTQEEAEAVLKKAEE